jgi:hypothetical protein
MTLADYTTAELRAELARRQAQPPALILVDLVDRPPPVQFEIPADEFWAGDSLTKAIVANVMRAPFALPEPGPNRAQRRAM